MSLLDHIEINPKSPATASVIWLHGLGASGDDFVPIVPELMLPDSMAVRFIFPHAPVAPVTINGGYAMQSWYDILSIGVQREFNAGQLKQSAANIQQFINSELDKGIAADRILIAGFSQGGAVAYEAALSFNRPLAGLLCMSTYFATQEDIKPCAENQDIPILVCHGRNDDVVPEALGQDAVTVLRKMGYKPEYKQYNMYHEVCAEQIKDISGFIQQCLSD